MLFPWKDSYDKPRQHIKKQRHHFANKVRVVKAMVFPVIMYKCESGTIKRAEHWKPDAFELWCCRRLKRLSSSSSSRRLSRVPWTRRSNRRGFFTTSTTWEASYRAYLTYIQSTSCEMLGWMNPKLESRLPGEISTTYIGRWYYFNGTNWRETKEPL